MLTILKKIINRNEFLNTLISKKIIIYRLKKYILRNYDKNKKIIFCYDLINAPPTIGDFVFFLILIRLFINNRVIITILIINDKYRDSWKFLNDSEVVSLEKKFINLIKQLIPKIHSNNIKLIKFNNLKEYSSDDIFLQNLISKRKPLYLHCYNLISALLRNQNNKKINKVLLSNLDFDSTKITLPSTKYITWHVRLSKKWDKHRNLNKEEFLNIYDLLISNFSDYKIMIVSDKIGCDYYKNNNDYKNLKLIFSDDYSNNFEGSSKLVLNSSFYFQYKGGGMFATAVMSNVPYLICLEIGKLQQNEILFQKEKLTSFSKNTQIHRQLSNLKIDDLKFSLLKIKSFIEF